MNNKVKVLVKMAMFCMIAILFLPTKGYAQTLRPSSGDIYYYKRADECLFLAVKFMDGYVVSYSLHVTSRDFKQFKENKDFQGLKKYFIGKIDNKTEKMSYSVNKSGEAVYGTEYTNYTFSKDYKSMSSFDMEASAYGMNPFDSYTRIDLKNIFSFSCSK